MSGIQQGHQQQQGVSEPDGPPDWQGRRERRLALVVASGSAVVVGFQLALVAGAGWGAAAYGGANHGPLPAGALTGPLAVGVVMNAASSSSWERFVWAPIVLALAIPSLLLARPPVVPPSRTAGATARGVRA